MVCQPIISLDSAAAASPWSRWSYRAGPASRMVRCSADGRDCRMCDAAGQVLKTWNDPLAALREISTWPGDATAAADFDRGWIGFISYDLGRWFEELPSRAVDDLHTPLFVFSYHQRIERLTPQPVSPVAVAAGNRPVHCNFTPDQYRTAVRRVIDYIAAGDVFQVNLSQRFTAELGALPPAEIYWRLLANHPAWMGAMLDYGDFALLSNSPELLLRIDIDPATGLRKIITRPIKGTRPAGPHMQAELLASEKDAAELNMIIDLERNDLGRVCQVGSVQVTQPRSIERHGTVLHGVATVQGTLRENVDLLDVLRALFPGGSVTGAPKIRAMQIIDELEPTRRGHYCGAIGYIADNGHCQFNLAIRTMLVKDGSVHIPVGGGIVADSDPEAEYQETLIKARAMFDAAGLTG